MLEKAAINSFISPTTPWMTPDCRHSTVLSQSSFRAAFDGSRRGRSEVCSCIVLNLSFIPGLIGPAIGARVLKNAEQILNNDGTYSFLPNEKIFLAALVPIAVLLLLRLLGKREKAEAKR